MLCFGPFGSSPSFKFCFRLILLSKCPIILWEQLMCLVRFLIRKMLMFHSIFTVYIRGTTIVNVTNTSLSLSQPFLFFISNIIPPFLLLSLSLYHKSLFKYSIFLSCVVGLLYICLCVLFLGCVCNSKILSHYSSIVCNEISWVHCSAMSFVIVFCGLWCSGKDDNAHCHQWCKGEEELKWDIRRSQQVQLQETPFSLRETL